MRHLEPVLAPTKEGDLHDQPEFSWSRRPDVTGYLFTEVSSRRARLWVRHPVGWLADWLPTGGSGRKTDDADAFAVAVAGLRTKDLPQ